MREAKYKVKQWVRFYQDNNLVIGVVEYVVQDMSYGAYSYHTNIGTVLEHFILDAR